MAKSTPGQSEDLTDVSEALKKIRRLVIERATVEVKGMVPVFLAPLPTRHGDRGLLEIRWYESFIEVCYRPESCWTMGHWWQEVAKITEQNGPSDPVTLEYYESWLFDNWAYDDGTYCESDTITDSIFWKIDRNLANDLEEIASEIEMSLNRSLIPEDHSKDIMRTIRAGNGKWMPGRVEWTYIKKLDDTIRQLEAVDTSERAVEQEMPLERLNNPVTCSEVAGIIHKRSDNVARTLASHRYPVVKSGRNSYCDAEHAAVIYPKWKKHWENKKMMQEI